MSTLHPFMHKQFISYHIQDITSVMIKCGESLKYEWYVLIINWDHFSFLSFDFWCWCVLFALCILTFPAKAARSWTCTEMVEDGSEMGKVQKQRAGEI